MSCVTLIGFRGLFPIGKCDSYTLYLIGVTNMGGGGRWSKPGRSGGQVMNVPKTRGPNWKVASTRAGSYVK